MRGGSAEEIENFVQTVKEQRTKSRRWGWCTVQVTVQKKGYPEISGTAYLVGCSYTSQKDFIENSGQHDYMVKEALEKAQSIVFDKYCEVQDFIDNGVLEII